MLRGECAVTPRMTGAAFDPAPFEHYLVSRGPDPEGGNLILGAHLFVEAGVGDTLTKLVNTSRPHTDAVACVEGRGNHRDSFGRALERLADLGAVATSVIPDETGLPVPDVLTEWSKMGKVADYVLACLSTGTTNVLANGQSHA